ncbi:hypothetical protein ACJA23_00025 [Mycoplasma corogypsi]|uniref:hypothetical protein n=1 Tax=Mycoplasma corogypsi TaxID=2106 RepID=UPI003873458D
MMYILAVVIPFAMLFSLLFCSIYLYILINHKSKITYFTSVEVEEVNLDTYEQFQIKSAVYYPTKLKNNSTPVDINSILVLAGGIHHKNKSNFYTNVIKRFVDFLGNNPSVF